MNADLPDRSGAIVRPPLLYLGALAVGIAAEYVAPTSGFAFLASQARPWIGAALFAAGLTIVAGAFRLFSRAGTSIPVDKPTTAIVTSGPYRFSRNPIYIALTAAYLGLAVAVDSLWAVVLLAAVLAVMRYGVIAREEAYLERKFGAEYRAYKARVRRWL